MNNNIADWSSRSSLMCLYSRRRTTAVDTDCQHGASTSSPSVLSNASYAPCDTLSIRNPRRPCAALAPYPRTIHHTTCSHHPAKIPRHTGCQGQVSAPLGSHRPRSCRRSRTRRCVGAESIGRRWYGAPSGSCALVDCLSGCAQASGKRLSMARSSRTSLTCSCSWATATTHRHALQAHKFVWACQMRLGLGALL